MSPLVALLLIGFLFVVALCLALWAVLSRAGGPRVAGRSDRVAYVPLAPVAPTARVWRADDRAAAVGTARGTRFSTATDAPTSRTASATAEPAGGRAVVTTPAAQDAPAANVTLRVRARPEEPAAARSNDEYRGARANVKQRPNLDDAFDRFLDAERKER